MDVLGLDSCSRLSLCNYRASPAPERVHASKPLIYRACWRERRVFAGVCATAGLRTVRVAYCSQSSRRFNTQQPVAAAYPHIRGGSIGTVFAKMKAVRQATTAAATPEQQRQQRK